MKDKKHSAVQKQTDEISFLETLFIILQGKWTILFFVLICSIVAFIFAFGQLPTYKADALLRVEFQKASIPGIELLAGLDVDDTSVGTEIELIKSRKNLVVAVEALKLDIVAQPKRIPLFSNLHRRFFSLTEIKKPPPIWEKLDRWVNKFAWGNEQIKVDRLDVSEVLLNKQLELVAKRDNLFEVKLNNEILLEGKVGQALTSKDDSISIFVSKLTGLEGTQYRVTKLSKRRSIAALKRKISASEKGRQTGIIALSLTGKKQKEIIEILNKISKNYVEQNISRSSEEASNALSFLEEQIKPVKEDVEKSEASLRKYRTKTQTADLSQETQAILVEISEIDTKLQKYSLSREELSQKYTEQHPTIQALNAQEAKLRSLKERTQEKIAKLPKAQQELFELERNIKVSNSIYIDLLNKIQEFKIAKASTVGNAYIVDNADIDETFLSPNRKLILLLGLPIGVILGLVIIFLRKALRYTIDDPEKLEEAMGIPVYATIPFTKGVKLTGGLGSKNRKQKSLLAIANKDDQAIESLRSLRTSLHFAMLEAKNNIVMITGPQEEVGKSFVSSNFAAVIAAGEEQRVLLIDADMRKGYLHNLFNLIVSPGLSDIISGKVNTIDEVIHTVDVGDFTMDVITRGQTPPNPSELLMHSRFEKLLSQLSGKYDIIVVDTPPVHAVTDPSIIGKHSGVVFMVVRSELHSYKEIERAVARLANAGVDTKGFIFNGFKVKKHGYGYDYGYYSYK